MASLIKRRRQGRRLVAIMTDTHAGKDVGLLNPDTVLVGIDDQGNERLWKPEQTTTQRWLWSVFMDARNWLVDLAGKDEIVLIHNGDVTNGNKYAGNIPNTTMADQRDIAVDNLLAYVELQNVKMGRLITGTAVHVPECAEARVAHRLKNRTGKDIRPTHHARFSMGQDVIEVAHHGAYPGSRDWLKGNVALYHLKDRVYVDRRHDIHPARIYVYGHYHQLVYASLRDLWCGESCKHDLVVVPAFSGLDDYIRKIAKSPPFIQAGIVVLEFIDGVLVNIYEHVQEFDARTEETL